MSERLRNLLYGALILIMGAAVAFLVATSPSEADRIEQLGNSIKCPVCQGESIADSPSAMARDMMAVVRERVDQGWTDEEIVNDLLASYSGAVLLDPPASGATLWLWIAPALALVMGLGVIVWWKRHPYDGPASDAPKHPSRSGRRALVGGLILSGLFAAIVVAAGFFLQERDGPAAGVADLGENPDLTDVSNETMEAVIAANAEDPQINGMRLALAERYYELGDYRSAFPHYLAVAESETSSQTQAVSALIRLGWMAWSGNGEANAAIGMFDQALAIDPRSSTARYLKAQVLWCGSGEFEQAEVLLNRVLDDQSLPEDSLARVEEDLRAVMQRSPCP